MNKKNDTLTTTDLGLAAALVSEGFTISLLDRTHASKVGFIFKQEGNMEEMINDYWSDKLKVKAQSYFNSIKMLKSRVHDN